MEIALLTAFTNHQLGRGLSPTTTRRRIMSIRQFMTAIRPVAIEDATPELVEEWIFAFRSAATRRAYRGDLQAFFTWATRHHVAQHNPVAATDSIRVPKLLPRPVPASYLPSILASAVPHVRIMIALAAYAGLRCAEIANLDRSDIDLTSESPTIAVRLGKGKKDRIVPVHPDLARVLGRLPAGPVVGVCSKTVGQKVSEHLHSLGIDATAHKLRHTFGTELARATNGNVVLVATLMGHESIQTSMGYVGWAGGPGADAVASMYPQAAA